MKVLLLAILLVFAAVGVGLARGVLSWSAATRRLRARIEGARIPVTPGFVDFRELEGLPAPVQRYFRTVLTDGQPMVTGVRVRHRGTFNTGKTADRWRPFTSEQRVVTRRAGFDWDGRIRIAPGLTVRVHDAYVAGEGILSASLSGILPLMDLHGTGAMAEGELMRFLAEAAWYPTALLPSQGVRWSAIDATSARATFTDGALTIALHFGFAASGVIATVWADARGRTVGRQVVPTPWLGRFWDHQERGGMLLPVEGEVAWLLPEGARPYWRGRITAIEHEFGG